MGLRTAGPKPNALPWNIFGVKQVSDISVIETETHTEMIGFSKTDT